MMDDNIITYYESLMETQKEEKLFDWIQTLKSVRGMRRTINDICKDCNIKYISISETKKVCPSCGVTFFSLTYASTPTKTLPYKKLTHFKDWILKTQGKHNPKMDDKVIEICKNATKNYSYKSIKKILKIHNLTRHYEDIWYIISILKPDEEIFKLSQIEENLLYSLFLKIQHIWETIKPKHRKSIISYPFIITKLLDIIKRPELKKFFYLPRHNKILEYETCWRRIINSPLFSLSF